MIDWPFPKNYSKEHPKCLSLPLGSPHVKVKLAEEKWGGVVDVVCPSRRLRKIRSSVFVPSSTKKRLPCSKREAGSDSYFSTAVKHSIQ